MMKHALYAILNNITATLPMKDAADAISDALDYVMNGGDHPDWFTAAPANIPGDNNKKALYELIVVRLDKPVEQMQIKEFKHFVRISIPTEFKNFISLIKTIREYMHLGLKEAKDIADTAMARRPGWSDVGHIFDPDLLKKFMQDLKKIGIDVS